MPVPPLRPRSPVWLRWPRRTARLRFTADQVLARVERHGDLFAPVLTLVQRIG